MTKMNSANALTEQMKAKHHWLHVYFEQGRGKGGVPKTIVQVHPNEPIDSILKKAVAHMRISCEDEKWGHGKDLMPGFDYDEYDIHGIEGGIVEDHQDILWVQRDDGHWVCHVVLCWGLPSQHLMREVVGG